MGAAEAKEDGDLKRRGDSIRAEFWTGTAK